MYTILRKIRKNEKSTKERLLKVLKDIKNEKSTRQAWSNQRKDKWNKNWFEQNLAIVLHLCNNYGL